VNLHDASVVVHLDLSWNPARMEQRVGRLRRIGAMRDRIVVYTMAPPAPAERMLQLDRRLRVKLGVAAKTLGVAGTILPGFAAANLPESAARREEEIAAMMRGWLRVESDSRHGEVVAGAVHSSHPGAIACVRFDGVPTLLAMHDDQVSDSRPEVAELLRHAGGADLTARADELEIVRGRVEAWLRRRAISDVIDLPALRVARCRRAVLHRVETIAQRAPRHTQSRLAPLMHAARRVATAMLSAGAERVLDELASAPMNDSAWLQAVGEFATLHARGGEAESEVLAILLLRSS
jgi:hypothetical protein